MTGPPFNTAGGCPPLKLPHKDATDARLLRANWDQLEYWAMQLTCGGEVCANFRAHQEVAESFDDSTVKNVVYDVIQGQCGDFLFNGVSLTFQDLGDYMIFAGINWTPNVVGWRGLDIIRTSAAAGHGAASIATVQRPAVPAFGFEDALSVATMFPMAIGDRIRVQAYQTSGAPLNTVPDTHDGLPNPIASTYLAVVKKCACITAPSWPGAL